MSIDSVFKELKSYVNNLSEELKSDVINAVTSELQSNFNNYTSELQKLPNDSKELLVEKYNLESLDNITISSVVENEVILISADRVRDARVLEYIYGKQTPVQSLLAKISSKSSMMSLLKKWSK